MRKICFVAETGRSGSRAIGDYLNRHDGVKAAHEFRQQQIAWSSWYEKGNVARAQITRSLRQLFLTVGNSRDTDLHIESDQKHFNLISVLADLLPEAKVIWMIRNGRDFVNSAVGRFCGIAGVSVLLHAS